MSKVKTLVELTKFVTKGVEKALSGRGKLSRANNSLIKRQSNKADMPVSEFKQKARQIIKNKKDGKDIKPSKGKKKTYPSLESQGKGKANNPPTSKDQGSTAGLTKKQKAIRRSLIRQSEEADKKAKAQQQGIVSTGKEPDRIKLTAGGTEVLPSKEQIDPKIRNYSKARIRHLIKTGQAKMVVDKKGKRSIVTTGKFSSPKSMVAEEMGLGGKGTLPTEEEAKGMGMSIKSFKSGSGKKTIGRKKRKKVKKPDDYIEPWLRGRSRDWWLSSDRKSGGMVKKNTGGSVRGVGKAMRGFGKAKYSKKMY